MATTMPPSPPSREPASTGRASSDRSLFDPPSCSEPPRDSFGKLDPRHDGAQPGDVRGRGRQRAHHDPLPPRPRIVDGDENVFAGLVAAWLWFTVLFANFAEADGRGAGQGPGRHAAQDPVRDRRPRAAATARSSSSARARSCSSATCASSTAGELIPGDGEVVEGIATRRRVGHHRRVGAGDPRVRRRPLGGHRRHPGALRRDRRAHHGQSRARPSSTA